VAAAACRGLYTTTSGKKSDPLRILFCGSDVVSTEALHALHEEWTWNRDLIQHLEVVVLPPKNTGRGLKTKTVVPCMKAAEELGLPYYEINTFRDWELPSGINLIIAVSFGLFVPPRLLRQAKYGGLNVHPSFLPDLRGPAPIHHAILRGDEYMGVSLQTMHEEKFDHGVVLSQTPGPGLQIRPHPTMTRTTRKLAIECAELLVQGLRDGLHVPPYEDAGWKAKELKGKPLQHAPKITTGDTEVDWVNWTPAEWERHLRLRRAVWTTGLSSKGGKPKRLLIHDATQVPEEEVSGKKATMEVMTQVGRDDEVRFRKLVSVNTKTGDVYILLHEGVWVKVRRATLEGRPEKPAATGVRDFLVDWEEGKKSRTKEEVAEETKTESS